MCRIKQTLLIILLNLSLVLSLHAQDKETKTTAQGEAHQHEVVPQEEVDAITSRLIAPCCWSETANLHKSPAARKVQQAVLKGLQDGKSAEEIKAALVAKYGERILATPKLEGFNYLVFILPVAALCIGGIIVWGYLNRSQSIENKGGVKKNKSSDSYSSQIEKELQDFEN